MMAAPPLCLNLISRNTNSFIYWNFFGLIYSFLEDFFLVGLSKYSPKSNKISSVYYTPKGDLLFF